MKARHEFAIMGFFLAAFSGHEPDIPGR